MFIRSNRFSRTIFTLDREWTDSQWITTVTDAIFTNTQILLSQAMIPAKTTLRAIPSVRTLILSVPRPSFGMKSTCIYQISFGIKFPIRFLSNNVDLSAFSAISRFIDPKDKKSEPDRQSTLVSCHDRRK